MRPDDHKKKKNAAYKKKHGIKDGGKNVKETKSVQKDKRRPEAEGADSKQQYARKASTLESSPKQVSKHNEANDLTFNERKHFKKRTIESNWDRYEGLSLTAEDSEENVQMRGADFKLIVEGSGNALSQFQFKDEKEWNIDEDEKAEDTEIIKYLSIDSDELALALKCVPLHERLELDESDLQPALIQRFEESANRHKENYLSRHTDEKDCEEKVIISKNETENLQESTEKLHLNSEQDLLDRILGSEEDNDTKEIDDFSKNLDDLLKIDSPSDSCDKQCVTNKESDRADKTASNTPKHYVEKETSVKAITNSEKPKKSMEDTLDDNLDFLLSLETKETPGDTLQESTIDDILIRDITSPRIEDKSKYLPAPTSKGASSGLTDSLDDWLDSVLDD